MAANLTGKERVIQLGFDPRLIWFTSPGGKDYTFYWNANTAYNSLHDSFYMLQHSGSYGGRGSRWVKAKNLTKWTQHY